MSDVSTLKTGISPMFRRKTATSIPYSKAMRFFPHMTVFENVAFGLRMQKNPGGRNHPAGDGRFEKWYSWRRLPSVSPTNSPAASSSVSPSPGRWSTKPRLLLLDESLSALDYKLRKQMQNELKALQRKLGITFVFVTHDRGRSPDHVRPHCGDARWQNRAGRHSA